MNYHNITTDDMNNGSGLRVVLWLSGCNHYCEECQNPQTWDANSGVAFDYEAYEELTEKLNKSYISGLTLSGGDPLYPGNLSEVLGLVKGIKNKFPNKTIWLYTGFNWEDILADKSKLTIIKCCDVVVDGKFNKILCDVKYPWAGSTNQRVIDVQKSLEKNEVVLWQS